MTRTPSTMLALGTPLPPFRLPDLDGAMVSADDFRGAPALLIAFICNHCPFARHVRQEFSRFATEYQQRGLAIVGINSNDIEAFPEDGPEGMRRESDEASYSFPYLFDEGQDVAKAFHAACTPDLFLFDRSGRLVYRGQFDDSRPGNQIPVTGRDLRAAADAALAGRPVPSTQKASVGCNIKWKAGNEPVYAKNSLFNIRDS
jgi:peroxiredoxin